MNRLIPTNPNPITLAGQIANQIAGSNALEDYKERKAANTIKRQANDLELFADYLRATTLDPGDFFNDLQAWTGITWGLVEGFTRWLLSSGYAIGSVNVALTTVRIYATLAAKAGTLNADELTRIKAVKGYKRSEGRHVDELRESTRRTKRRGGSKAYKKADSISISIDQAAGLKAQPYTPQGRRDRLIMCLLLDHGLRVGELAALTVDCFNLAAGELVFYRPKVDRTQTHKLTPDTLAAAKDYLAKDAPAIGSIWRGTHKGGKLEKIREITIEKGKAKGTTYKLGYMSARAITQRVTDLGAAMGIQGLSAHDCRHYWATQAARNGTPLERLQDAGGWSSLAMPGRYIESARIANQGVKLG